MNKFYKTIQLDNTRNDLLSDAAKLSFSKFYRFDGDNIQELFARSANFYCGGDVFLAQRMYDYVSKGWLNFSSPIQSGSYDCDWKNINSDWNMGQSGVSHRLENCQLDNENQHIDIPERSISCFLTFIDDTLESQKNGLREISDLSTAGGGVGTYLNFRGASKKAPGILPFTKVIDSTIVYFNQSTTRKGSICIYLDISHPDCERFLTIRDTISSKDLSCININNGLVITDEFLDAVYNGLDWNFICPYTKQIVSTCNAKRLYQKILYIRKKLGEPMLMCWDAVDESRPAILKELDVEIYASNLCSEIVLPTSEDMTSVCCLSSLNISRIDEWKDTRIVEDLTVFLDNVLQYFYDINHIQEVHKKSNNSVRMWRDIGIGQMGISSYLQQNSIAWSDGGVGGAVSQNARISKLILNRAKKESISLAKSRGLPSSFGGLNIEVIGEDGETKKYAVDNKVFVKDVGEVYAFQLEVGMELA